MHKCESDIVWVSTLFQSRQNIKKKYIFQRFFYSSYYYCFLKKAVIFFLLLILQFCHINKILLLLHIAHICFNMKSIGCFLFVDSEMLSMGACAMIKLQ